MLFKDKLFASIGISAAAMISSIAIPIIPCRIGPAVPNPSYKWAMCNLNPDNIANTLYIKEYFGFTKSITQSYFIIILSSFILAMAFFHFISKKKE